MKHLSQIKCNFLFDQFSNNHHNYKLLQSLVLLNLLVQKDMHYLFEVNCVECNYFNENMQEKQQQKLAQVSFVSSLYGNKKKSALSPQNNNLGLGAILESKKQRVTLKLSLKSPKKSNIRLNEYMKISSLQNNSKMTNGQSVKSPPAKITITYRPISFVPSINSLRQQPAYGQKNKVNYQKLRNYKQQLQPILLERQISSKNDQITYQPLHNISTSKKEEDFSIGQEAFTNYMCKSNDSIIQENCNFVGHKRIHFSDFQQNLKKPERIKQNYSAFVSQANTNKNISLELLQDFNNSENVTFESDKDITEISEIKQQIQTYQLRRAPKKNFTFFKQEQKRLVGIRTVNTIKSAETPSEGSYLDVNFMQKVNLGFEKKLLS